nr:glycosyltransferase [Arthrobacter sp. SDTb3-6]
MTDCLASIKAQHPAEVIVVDGCSTDATVDIAQAAGARVLSDGGRGVAAARMLGAQAARSEVLALIDADVLVPAGALETLLSEFTSGHYDGLQFALASHSDSDDYWGRALAWHHNHSRVREWFCVCATLMRRDLLLEFGFDEDLRSGEDIELRVRLKEAGARLGVSRTTTVAHRFSGGFDNARDQWVQDGAGLARTAAKHPSRAGWVVALPLLATVRGAGLSLAHAPRYLPYWAGFLGYNYQSMVSEWMHGTRART